MPTTPDTYATFLSMSVQSLWGLYNPGLPVRVCVSSSKLILWQWQQELSHKYQVLLDDGIKIIIPHRNFKNFKVVACTIVVFQ